MVIIKRLFVIKKKKKKSIESGRGRTRLDGEDEDNKDGIRFVTLKSRFEKQGNSLKFVNHKSVMSSM